MEVTEAKLFIWLERKTFLDVAKKAEMDARTEICDELLKDKEVGTHNFEIGSYNVKAVKNVNTKIDGDELETWHDEMSNEEVACLRFKPELIAKNYKVLDTDEKKILDKCIVVTPGAPTLTVT